MHYIATYHNRNSWRQVMIKKDIIQGLFKENSSSVTRREFLKKQLKGALWLSIGTSGLLLPHRSIADVTPDITVVKGGAAASARAAVDLLGGMGSIVKKGQSVLIKPNMSFANPPEWGTTTSPEVVKELALMCKEAGASKVLIVDNTLYSPKSCLEKTGIRDACKEVTDTIVTTVNSAKLYKEMALKSAIRLSKTDVLKEALEADVLIAAPVAKSHSATGVSLSMKGMMGLVYDRGIMHSLGLDSCVVDICFVLKADLTVVDATRVLSTNGPRGPGKVLNEQTVIASRDMVAADACTVSLFKWNGSYFAPKNVGHIREAHERGLGRMDLENMNIKKVVL
jgi:uncharacterized protein (DUF362 family)